LSCNVGTNAGTCSPTDLGSAADTCFQCVTPEGLSESSGCLYGSTCNSFYRACRTATDSAANFSVCQASNCNSCGSSSLSTSIRRTYIAILSLGTVFVLSSYTDARLLCIPRSLFAGSTSSGPFPFGSDTSFQSVLIWNNVDLFAFSSSDCSGASLQPSQIVSDPQPDKSTCFTEYPRPKMLPPSSSLLIEEDSATNVLKQFGFSLWKITPFPTQTCQPLLQPPPPPPAIDALGIIGIFTDILLPLLLLAFSFRSFLSSRSRLTLPRFTRLWFCCSGLQDRCAAWFVTSTMIDFFIQLFSNISALSWDAFLWNWIGIFPISMVFRPVMASLIFLNPGRLTASVLLVEGCLMTTSAYLRLKDLFPAPRIINLIPPLMFTLSNVVFLLLSSQPTSQHAIKSASLGIRICHAIFGDSGPTIFWHNNRVLELVNAVFRRQNTPSGPSSPTTLITAPNPMSARMVTLLCMALYWILMCFTFFVSGIVYIRTWAVGWDKEPYNLWIAFACNILLCISPLIFCFHLKEVLTRYYGRFVRMSKLCRRGLVPSRLQSVTSFHFAAKCVSSEAVRIMYQYLYLYLRVGWWTLVIALLVIAAILLQNISPVLFNWFARFFIRTFSRGFVNSIEILLSPPFWNFCSIVLLSNLFASSWFSLFRFFRVEHPLVQLPKRIASCCCIQFRCVRAASIMLVIFFLC
jgi:hypothetical protein